MPPVQPLLAFRPPDPVFAPEGEPRPAWPSPPVPTIPASAPPPPAPGWPPAPADPGPW